MYSKVKGRAAKPTDLKEPGSSISSSENEKNAPPKKRHSSDPVKESIKSRSTKTQRSKSTVKAKDKFSEGQSDSKSGEVKASARKIEFQFTSESESDLDIMDKRNSFPTSVSMGEEKDKDIERLAKSLDHNAILKTPKRSVSLTTDSQSTDSTKTVNYSEMGSSDVTDTDKMWDKSLLSTPEGCKIMTDFHTSSSAKTINYSMLQGSDNEEMLTGNGKEKTEVNGFSYH